MSANKFAEVFNMNIMMPDDLRTTANDSIIEDKKSLVSENNIIPVVYNGRLLKSLGQDLYLKIKDEECPEKLRESYGVLFTHPKPPKPWNRINEVLLKELQDYRNNSHNTNSNVMIKPSSTRNSYNTTTTFAPPPGFAAVILPSLSANDTTTTDTSNNPKESALALRGLLGLSSSSSSSSSSSTRAGNTVDQDQLQHDHTSAFADAEASKRISAALGITIGGSSGGSGIVVTGSDGSSYIHSIGSNSRGGNTYTNGNDNGNNNAPLQFNNRKQVPLPINYSHGTNSISNSSATSTTTSAFNSHSSNNADGAWTKNNAISNSNSFSAHNNNSNNNNSNNNNNNSNTENNKIANKNVNINNNTTNNSNNTNKNVNNNIINKTASANILNVDRNSPATGANSNNKSKAWQETRTGQNQREIFEKEREAFLAERKQHQLHKNGDRGTAATGGSDKDMDIENSSHSDGGAVDHTSAKIANGDAVVNNSKSINLKTNNAHLSINSKTILSSSSSSSVPAAAPATGIIRNYHDECDQLMMELMISSSDAQTTHNAAGSMSPEQAASPRDKGGGLLRGDGPMGSMSNHSNNNCNNSSSNHINTNTNVSPFSSSLSLSGFYQQQQQNSTSITNTSSPSPPLTAVQVMKLSRSDEHLSESSHSHSNNQQDTVYSSYLEGIDLGALLGGSSSHSNSSSHSVSNSNSSHSGIAGGGSGMSGLWGSNSSNHVNNSNNGRSNSNSLGVLPSASINVPSSSSSSSSVPSPWFDDNNNNNNSSIGHMNMGSSFNSGAHNHLFDSLLNNTPAPAHRQHKSQIRGAAAGASAAAVMNPFQFGDFDDGETTAPVSVSPPIQQHVYSHPPPSSSLFHSTSVPLNVSSLFGSNKNNDDNVSVASSAPPGYSGVHSITSSNNPVTTTSSVASGKSGSHKRIDVKSLFSSSAAGSVNATQDSYSLVRNSSSNNNNSNSSNSNLDGRNSSDKTNDVLSSSTTPQPSHSHFSFNTPHTPTIHHSGSNVTGNDSDGGVIRSVSSGSLYTNDITATTPTTPSTAIKTTSSGSNATPSSGVKMSAASRLQLQRLKATVSNSTSSSSVTGSSANKGVKTGSAITAAITPPSIVINTATADTQSTPITSGNRNTGSNVPVVVVNDQQQQRLRKIDVKSLF